MVSFTCYLLYFCYQLLTTVFVLLSSNLFPSFFSIRPLFVFKGVGRSDRVASLCTALKAELIKWIKSCAIEVQPLILSSFVSFFISFFFSFVYLFFLYNLIFLLLFCIIFRLFHSSFLSSALKVIFFIDTQPLLSVTTVLFTMYWPILTYLSPLYVYFIRKLSEL